MRQSGVDLVRVAAVLAAVLAVGGCGLGLAGSEPEPSGAWTDAGGRTVDRQQVESSQGPEHCGWQAAHFLGVSWPPGRTYDDPRRLRTFVRDPEGVLPAPALQAGFDRDAPLPGDAVDTGYRNDGYALWYSPGRGDAVVYLVRGEARSGEAWPRDTQGVACA